MNIYVHLPLIVHVYSITSELAFCSYPVLIELIKKKSAAGQARKYHNAVREHIRSQVCSLASTHSHMEGVVLRP